MGRQKKENITPLMQQFFEIKKQHPGVLLFFQVGDFYELFFEDAKIASEFLGIALTKRGKMDEKPIPLCGVPLHTRNHYLTKLVRGGFKVAICDQLEQPVPGKVVKRGVTQVLTPGMLIDDQLLDKKSASYLFSFFPGQNQWGLLFGEILTAQLFATVLPLGSEKTLESELVRFFPDEILLPHCKRGKSFKNYFDRLGYFTSVQKFDLKNYDQTSLVEQWITRQFKSQQVSHINKNDSLFCAFHNFYLYVQKNQSSVLEQFNSLNIYSPDDFLVLDSSTQRNLELTKNHQDGSRKNTLFFVMDKAATSMGSRMIKKWITRPLVKKISIIQRQELVSVFAKSVVFTQKIRELLSEIGDLERVVGRIALRRDCFHDFICLMRALSVLPNLKKLLQVTDNNIVLLKIIVSRLGDFSSLYQLLVSSLNDDHSVDWIIRPGFDNRLDRFRELVENSNKKILELEKEEQQKTKISSLKVRYNKVHGYYIEVTKPNVHLVPERYSRQQTLVGRERFITRELDSLQAEIIHAQQSIDIVEKEVFDSVRQVVLKDINALRKSAHAIANLDAVHSFGCVAYDYGYVCPSFNDKRDIVIKDGRHPIVELSREQQFIPNDTNLINDQSLWIITGPNMGGKSTYLRQTALICIMAQIGSFVPAVSANLALLDRIFTRIGSGDNLAGGKSTFFVEMEETALICRQATKNSLVILDEVGRGTSTFDGLAIAQAVVEYLYCIVQARCLFATHYHELTTMKDRFSGIESFYASSKKTKNGVLFLYRMVKGVADGSFGLEVARLAQLPESLLKRADSILHGLTKGESSQKFIDTSPNIEMDNTDLLNEVSDLSTKLLYYEKKMEKLEKIDYDDLSPKKAFDLLWNLKDK